MSDCIGPIEKPEDIPLRDTWSLDYTMAKFMLPRLIRYWEVADEVIVIDEDHEESIKAGIKAMEIILRSYEDEDGEFIDREEWRALIRKFADGLDRMWW